MPSNIFQPTFAKKPFMICLHFQTNENSTTNLKLICNSKVHSGFGFSFHLDFIHAKNKLNQYNVELCNTGRNLSCLMLFTMFFYRTGSSSVNLHIYFAILRILYRNSVRIFIPGRQSNVTKITKSPFSEIPFLKIQNSGGVARP